ncbi:MAG: hypothetical protein AB7Q81_25005 [Gammaproteobacteria bacterium]
MRIALTAIFTLVGLLGLGATLLHRGEYPGRGPLLFDTVMFTTIALGGLGLLRRRRWAAHLATALVYLVFFAVLAMLSLMYDTAGRTWWYWLLPLALPMLGYAVHSLRRQRAEWLRGW